jgi:hypothetical protein
MGIVEINHFEILTKFHSGLTEQECLIISQLTNDGYCIYLVCEENTNKIINYHVYNKIEKDGQIIRGTEATWQTFKNNKYSIDESEFI